jgi:folate-binding protein YgfZ
MNTHVRLSGPLPHLGLLRIAGADAAAFLQGQLSNDTRRLSGGTSVLAAYSNVQGRVAAVLRLLPHSSGIMALLPRELVGPTLERLRKFVLRSKVELADMSEHFTVAAYHDAACLAADALPIPTEVGAYAELDGIGVARINSGIERYWAIGDRAALAEQCASRGAEPARAERDWRLADIRDGQPQVYAATQELFIAQMLNLDLIDGISFTKGCYTGQEIIARTQHLGRIKRRMFRLRLPEGDWSIGQNIALRDGRSGRLSELARADEGWEALAVLTLEPSSAVSSAAPVSDGAETPDPVSALVDAIDLPLPYSLSSAK